MMFTIDNITDFVKDHIQSKIDHNELEMDGFDMVDVDEFEKQIEFYYNAMLEGVINGILMSGGEVEGFEV